MPKLSLIKQQLKTSLKQYFSAKGMNSDEIRLSLRELKLPRAFNDIFIQSCLKTLDREKRTALIKTKAKQTSEDYHFLSRINPDLDWRALGLKQRSAAIEKEIKKQKDALRRLTPHVTKLEQAETGFKHGSQPQDVVDFLNKTKGLQGELRLLRFQLHGAQFDKKTTSILSDILDNIPTLYGDCILDEHERYVFIIHFYWAMVIKEESSKKVREGWIEAKRNGQKLTGIKARLTNPQYGVEQLSGSHCQKLKRQWHELESSYNVKGCDAVGDLQLFLFYLRELKASLPEGDPMLAEINQATTRSNQRIALWNQQRNLLICIDSVLAELSTQWPRLFSTKQSLRGAVIDLKRQVVELRINDDTPSEAFTTLILQWRDEAEKTRVGVLARLLQPVRQSTTELNAENLTERLLATDH